MESPVGVGHSSYQRRRQQRQAKASLVRDWVVFGAFACLLLIMTPVPGLLLAARAPSPVPSETLWALWLTGTLRFGLPAMVIGAAAAVAVSAVVVAPLVLGDARRRRSHGQAPLFIALSAAVLGAAIGLAGGFVVALVLYTAG